MTDELRIIVPKEYAGERLDKAASVLFDTFSRMELTRWIKAGELVVDGRSVKANYKLHGGEALLLTGQREVREAWQAPQALDFEIVYEDDQVIVVNKPVGLVVHPGAGNPDLTLVNGLLHHRPEQKLLPRAGIVHRLDKDTSGLMVVAATAEANQSLVEQIAQRTVQRRYLALCEGRMVAGVDVDAPIGRDPHHRTRQAVRDDGKPARTRFRIEQRFRVHTLVMATLDTGRTHQIRVHSRHIGHPLVGDRRYGARGLLPPGAAPELIEQLQSFPRQALHAAELAFQHPSSGESLAFSVALPADMAELVDALQTDLDG